VYFVGVGYQGWKMVIINVGNTKGYHYYNVNIFGYVNLFYNSHIQCNVMLILF